MSWHFEHVDGPYGNVTEGPAWDGEALLFTSIQQSRIMRYYPATGASTVYREDTNFANGLMFDPDGVLYACEGGARRVVRYETDGSATSLTDGFEGKRLNIPNDLAIDLQGRVWFTDPYYEGSGGDWSEDVANKDLDHDSVYRLDPQDGRVLVDPSGDVRHDPSERAAVLPRSQRPVCGPERETQGRASSAAGVSGQRRRLAG